MPTIPPYKLLPLTKGYFAKVDEEDFRILSAMKWQAQVGDGRVYGVCHRMILHRVILGLPRGGWPLVDHKNGDTLDCRKANLRLATPSQNSQNSPRRYPNTSGYRGVYERKDLAPSNPKRFEALCRLNGKTHRQARYATAEEAAHAYDEMARFLHGEFACLNFPKEGERSAKAGE